MSAVYYRRKKNKKYNRRRALLVIVLILLVAIFNADSIWRFFYPLPYHELTLKYARAYNQDPYLLSAMMKAESSFNPKAVSEKGARGLMQIMPETGQSVASELGYRNFSPDQLFIPDININIGAWYLADLDYEFNGNVILMLAAYNGGRGNVTEWIAADKSGGIKDIDQIPFPETRHYIQKVLMYQKIYTRLYSQGGG
ncbi:lytic transglycosylase domain-containing protein [Pelotomaculum propionicicum]|uniref:lytic transglycosylase domain-containing protein n=1 Tax=Pelotomaculum propionicicum TaxID=258475 RepID=UPI003B816DA4